MPLGRPAPGEPKFMGNLCHVHLRMAMADKGIELPCHEPGPFYILRRRGKRHYRVLDPKDLP